MDQMKAGRLGKAKSGRSIQFYSGKKDKEQVGKAVFQHYSDQC